MLPIGMSCKKNCLSGLNNLLFYALASSCTAYGALLSAV
jgi:hypothetical protein